MTEPAPDEKRREELLLRAVENYRNRARSFASMVVTGAGALVAGIVFSDWGLRLGVLGLELSATTLVFLLLSAAFLVSASIYADTSNAKLTRLGRLRNWLLGGRAAGEDPVEISHSLDLMSRILTRTRLGAMFAMAAAGGFVATIGVAWFAPDYVTVQVSLESPTQGCPSLGLTFQGQALRSAVGEGQVPVSVNAQDCDPGLEEGTVMLVVAATSVVVLG